LPVAPPATPPGPPASTADVHPVPDQPLAAVKAPAPAPESRLPAPAMATSSSVATGARAAPSPGSVGPPDAAADRGRASGSPPRQSADSGAASSSAGDGAATSGPGPLASAAVPSGDGRPGADYGAYYASFRKRVQEAAGYPVSARRRGISGTVEIEVLIDPTGAVRNVKLVASSSHAVLDDAALEAVRSVSPMPLPEHLPRRPFVFVLPVSFQLR
jgi:protein TonB